MASGGGAAEFIGGMGRARYSQTRLVFFPGKGNISALFVEQRNYDDPKKLLGMVRHNDVLSTHLYQDMESSRR